ncbi:MAG: hypothetical protein MJE66_18130 [Proteobacteria bacterium]|nr:hypothetical protein [Pseudomonadota bacterium]
MQIRDFVRVLATVGLLTLAAAAGCGPAPLRVFAPVNQSQLPWMPLFVDFDFAAAGLPETLVVDLNGHDIRDQIQLEVQPNGRTRGTGEFVWGAGLLTQGANTLTVQVQVGETTRTAVRHFEAVGDPYADVVTQFVPGSGSGFGLPADALGGPRGAGLFEGSLDVVSLGLGGVIVLEFTDNAIADGPGDDFAVFENTLFSIDVALQVSDPFSEPGRVSVSQDGVVWSTFPCALDLAAAPWYPGCAGVRPTLANVDDAATPHGSVPTLFDFMDLLGVSVLALPPIDGAGGDAFDLAEVGLTWARFVRIESAAFVDGPVGVDNQGFDLDAVAAINAVVATDEDGNGVPDAVE